jgi:hypothetical protein
MCLPIALLTGGPLFRRPQNRELTTIGDSRGLHPIGPAHASGYDVVGLKQALRDIPWPTSSLFRIPSKLLMEQWTHSTDKIDNDGEDGGDPL